MSHLKIVHTATTVRFVK